MTEEESNKFIHKNLKISKEDMEATSEKEILLKLLTVFEEAMECFKNWVAQKDFKKFITKNKKRRDTFTDLYVNIKASMALMFMLLDKIEKKAKEKNKPTQH